MHELVVLVIPEREQDFILANLRFRESLPKEFRKHLQGPTITTDGNRTFTFMPCEGIKIDKYRQEFIAHCKTNPHSRCIHIQFGNDLTTIAYSSDPTQVNEQMKAIWIDRIKKMEEEVSALRNALIDRTNELHEVIEERTRDQVLSAAVEGLKVIKKNRKLLDAALDIVREYKNKDNLSPEILRLVTADV